jgi:hypothetical protein
VKCSSDRGTAAKSVGDILNQTGKRRSTEGTGYAAADGTETIPAYDCAAGCPMADLDAQSGTLTSVGSAKNYRTPDKSEVYGTYEYSGRRPDNSYADTGGASRFFPTFRTERLCALYSLLTECDRVANVEVRCHPEAAQPGGSVPTVAPVTQRQESSASAPLSTPFAPTAKQYSATTRATTENTARPVVPPMQSEQYAQAAAYAANLCGSCATTIAQSVAATLPDHLRIRTLGLPSTGDSNERILAHSLALIAAALDKPGTTSITTDWTTSLGCAADAISAYITKASVPSTRRSDPGALALANAPSLKYQAKADSAERLRDGTVAHPTVKPLELMRWLVRLVTPPGGLVLDMFAGSGTTAEAALLEGFRCIAIERDASYLRLIRHRLNRRLDPVTYLRATNAVEDTLFGLA